MLELKLQGKEKQGLSTQTSLWVYMERNRQRVRENNGTKVPVTEGLKGRKRPAGQVRLALLS